jgi:hypothetical protein
LHTRIETVSERDATGELKEIYDAWFAKNPGRKEFPGILKCFSQRPDFLRDVISFSYGTHFQDGHLTRRLKEMIATYVSGLNQCPY